LPEKKFKKTVKNKTITEEIELCPKTWSIFISHSSKDDDIVSKIAEILTEYNISNYYDHERSMEGRGVRTTISPEFERSTDFLLIWSDDASKSEYVRGK